MMNKHQYNPNMRKMDIFCSSPASIAVSPSSMVRRSRSSKPYDAPCSSQLPLIPTSSHYYHKMRKSCSTNTTTRPNNKSSADTFSTPPSSRYLLGDIATPPPYIDWIASDSDRGSTAVLQPARSSLQPTKHSRLVRSNNDSAALVKSSSSSRHEVVVLRVSIHCKGCEGKVRKHLSKMEGVSSFSIDLAAKKVVVVGHVTPSFVLESISRVKKAQLWTAPTPMPTYSAVGDQQVMRKKTTF